VEIGPRGQRSSARADGAYFEDLDNTFIPTSVPHGWAAIVRPDRTVLHDGPLDEAARLVRESLQLIGAQEPSPGRTDRALATAAH
jgi:3-(3-hydroxy-phenyl)propionate hydroxylase